MDKKLELIHTIIAHIANSAIEIERYEGRQALIQ